jgi:hypothetical protein
LHPHPNPPPFRGREITADVAANAAMLQPQTIRL